MTFKIAGKTVFLCDCSRTMRLDEEELAKMLDIQTDFRLHHQLCTKELVELENGMAQADTIIACTQEIAVFDSLAEEVNSNSKFIHLNIREHAAWGDEAAKAGPKIAALIEAAAVGVRPPDRVTMVSSGRTLVYGSGEAALEAAAQLAGRLDTTLLLHNPEDLLPPSVPNFGIVGGRLREVVGHLGGFQIQVENFKEKDPSARSGIGFGPVAGTVEFEFDVIIDLSGETAFFGGSDRRDGYFSIDPGAAITIQKTLFKIVDLVGTFDKPRYITQDPDLCVHSRNKQVGCSRCLDNCPTSSITSLNDSVVVDEFSCAGCGQCSSVCPTGSVSYATPLPTDQCEIFRILLRRYLEAGGSGPVLLLYDSTMAETLLAIGRFGRGIPANVIPWDVGRITALGLDTILAAITYGAGQVVIAAGETKFEELHGLRGQLEIIGAIFEGLKLEPDSVILLEERDPTELEDILYLLAGSGLNRKRTVGDTSLRMGDKRDRIWLSLNYFKTVGSIPGNPISLPGGAPFGAIKLNESKCTLCLACVSVCPVGALLDNQDKPQVSFVEQACVQCGLCRTTCPEGAISLQPQLDLTEAAARARILMEEEPFNCVRCGKPFGVKSSIDKMVDKLKDHPMFKSSEAALDRIRMCEDCRVVDQFSDKQPFAVGTRRLTRTSDDYSEDG